MKLMWTGSDMLYATWAYGKRFPTKKSKIPYFYGCTLFAKIADLFVEGHYVVSKRDKTADKVRYRMVVVC